LVHRALLVALLIIVEVFADSNLSRPPIGQYTKSVSDFTLNQLPNQSSSAYIFLRQQFFLETPALDNPVIVDNELALRAVLHTLRRVRGIILKAEAALLRLDWPRPLISYAQFLLHLIDLFHFLFCLIHSCQLELFLPVVV